MESEKIIDKISMVMVVFGRSSEEVCRNCEDKSIFINECIEECPKGSFRYEYDEGGIGCKQCHEELNMKIKEDFSGCQCIEGSVKRSGKCIQVGPPRQRKNTTSSSTKNNSTPSTSTNKTQES